MSTLKSLLAGLSARITDEPVMTLALVQAAIALAVGFGAHLTGDQVAAIVAFSAALLGWVARSQVTPVQ